MEQNGELKLDVAAEDSGRRDTIMLRATKAGKGFKVVHNGIWYYASRLKVLDVVNRKKENCLFVTIDEDIVPAQ